MLQRIFTMQRYYGFLTIFVNGCILAGNNEGSYFLGPLHLSMAKFLVRVWYPVLSAIIIGNTGRLRKSINFVWLLNVL